MLIYMYPYILKVSQLTIIFMGYFLRRVCLAGAVLCGAEWGNGLLTHRGCAASG